jgi:hypothetical protein
MLCRRIKSEAAMAKENGGRFARSAGSRLENQSPAKVFSTFAGDSLRQDLVTRSAGPFP